MVDNQQVQKQEQEVVFVSGESNSYSIYAIDSNNNQYLVSDIFLRDVSFVGNGKYIGYYDKHIVLMDADSKELQYLFQPQDYITGYSIYLRGNDQNVYYMSKSGIIRHSIENEADEVIVSKKSASGVDFYVASDESSVYYKEDLNSSDLICMNPETNESRIVASGIRHFTVSEDEKFAIVQNFDHKSCVYKYLDLETGQEKDLFTTDNPSDEMAISADGSKILYKTYKEFVIPGNRTYKLHVYSIDSGDDYTISFDKKYGKNPFDIGWGKNNG